MDIDNVCMSKLNKILGANKDLGVKFIKIVTDEQSVLEAGTKNPAKALDYIQTIQQAYEMLLEIQTLNQIHQEYLEKKNEIKEELDEMLGLGAVADMVDDHQMKVANKVMMEDSEVLKKL